MKPDNEHSSAATFMFKAGITIMKKRQDISVAVRNKYEDI